MSDATEDLLILACAKISQPGAWTQQAFARLRLGGQIVTADSPNATCWCSLGVCRSLDARPNQVRAWDGLQPVIQAEARLNAWTNANHGQRLEQFNDTFGRTQAEIVEMFKAAIAAGPLPYQGGPHGKDL